MKPINKCPICDKKGTTKHRIEFNSCNEHSSDDVLQHISKAKNHKKRHKQLHQNFDELVADYIDHNFKIEKDEPFSLEKVSIKDLMKWSYEQTLNPTEKKK